MSLIPIFSPNARHLAVPVPQSSSIRLWVEEVPTLLENTKSGSNLILTAMTWTHDGGALCGGYSDNTIMIWNVENMEKSKRIKLKTQGGGKKGVVAMCSNPRGVYVLIRGVLFDVDAESGQYEESPIQVDEKVESMVTNEDGTRIALASSTNIVVYSLNIEGITEAPRNVAIYVGHSMTPSAMVFGEDNVLISADRTRPSLFLWKESQKQSSVDAPCCDSIAVALAIQKKRLVVVGSDGSVTLWKVSSNELRKLHVVSSPPVQATTAVFTSKNWVRFVCFNRDVPEYHTADTATSSKLLPSSLATPSTTNGGIKEGPVGMQGYEGNQHMVVASTLPRRYAETDAEWVDDPNSAPRKTVFMTLMLRQALRTEDLDTLRKVIYSTEEQYIADTIQSIPPSHAAFFLKQCTAELQDPSARTDRTRQLLCWVRGVIKYHGNHIRSLPHAYALVAPLRGILGEYSQTLDNVHSYTKRLGVLCRAATEWEDDVVKKGPPVFAVQKFSLDGNGGVTSLA